MKKILTVLLYFMFVFQACAQNGIWQWKIDMRNYSSHPAYKHPVAYLWIPQDCRKVKAVIVAQHNMEEISILEDAEFREDMGKIGVAELWICPRFNLPFNFRDGAWETLQETLDSLAVLSGYMEIASVPLIGIGHSAAASNPYYMAASRPDRVLACISVSGQWPYYRDDHFCPDIWSKEQNIDFIPCLETMGEYESAEDMGRKGVSERMNHPNIPLSMLACPAEGHFSYSKEKCRYLAMYIKKAMKYGHVDPHKQGWLMERWHYDCAPTVEPAPVGKYKGDPKEAFWYFDKEMVDATLAYGARFRGLKHQLLGVKLFGKDVPQQNTHNQLHPEFITEDDGLTIDLEPYFYDTVGGGSPRLRNWTHLPVGSRIGHSSNGEPYLEIIAAPAVVSGSNTLKLSFNRMATWEENQIFVDFAIKHPGDHEFRPAVQQARITLPVKLTEGEAQSISFYPLHNVKRGTKAIPLHASSTSGLKVGFYAECGPVYVHGDTLYFDKMPPKAKYPVKVSVVAWQYGRNVAPKIQTAEPVRQEFYIFK